MPVLCPTLVPKPFLPGILGRRIARWETVLDPGVPGYEISYGAPWEQLSGRAWKGYLWRNRPCCFFHFTLEPYLGVAPASGSYFFFGKHPPEHRAVLGGYHGMLSNVTIANHIIFLFTRDGIHYDVTEHSFGRGTLRLFSRIVQSLRPTPS
jgi:hypothetical protein